MLNVKMKLLITKFSRQKEWQVGSRMMKIKNEKKKLKFPVHSRYTLYVGIVFYIQSISHITVKYY